MSAAADVAREIAGDITGADDQRAAVARAGTQPDVAKSSATVDGQCRVPADIGRGELAGEGIDRGWSGERHRITERSIVQIGCAVIDRRSVFGRSQSANTDGRVIGGKVDVVTQWRQNQLVDF